MLSIFQILNLLSVHMLFSSFSGLRIWEKKKKEKEKQNTKRMVSEIWNSFEKYEVQSVNTVTSVKYDTA